MDRTEGLDEVFRDRRHGLHRRSEEHTSELQSQSNLVCRLLLEKKKKHPTSRLHRSPHLRPPPLLPARLSSPHQLLPYTSHRAASICIDTCPQHCPRVRHTCPT